MAGEEEGGKGGKGRVEGDVGKGGEEGGRVIKKEGCENGRAR